MAEAETLDVELRESRGKRNAHRLRRAGKLPAVLYGHGEKSVSLAVPTEQFEAAIRHGSKLVHLKGGAKGRALIHELQWDTFSTHVLHIDLMRVKAGERVTVTVPIELRGTAPGEREGGVVETLLHEVEIETEVRSIPDKLHININELGLNESCSTDDFEDLPTGARVVSDEPQTVVNCHEPMEEAEEEVAAAGEVEPEIIGKKEDDEEGDAS